MRNLLGQIATQTEPWRAGLAVSGDPSAAGALFPAIPVLTFTNAPDLYTASARFVVAFPLEYSPKVYQSVDRQ